MHTDGDDDAAEHDGQPCTHATQHRQSQVRKRAERNGWSAPVSNASARDHVGAQLAHTDECSEQPRTSHVSPVHLSPRKFVSTGEDSEGQDDRGNKLRDVPEQVNDFEDLTAIDWLSEYAKERERIRTIRSLPGFRKRLLLSKESAKLWTVIVGTGLSVGLIAAAIDIVTDWLADLKVGVCSSHYYLNRVFCCWGYSDQVNCPDFRLWAALFGISSPFAVYAINYLVFVVAAVIFASIASFLVGFYAPFSKQSGIPEIKTILGGYIIRDFMGANNLMTKSVGICLAVASNMWLGKEGPLVHIACCCAQIFIHATAIFKNNEAKQREILSAAVAAGISVAFGAPIGGVLFSLEQVSYYFPERVMWSSFICAMVAAVTLQAMNPFRTGKLVLYQASYESPWHSFEFISFSFLGILGGLVGALFLYLNKKVVIFRKAAGTARFPISEVAIVAFVTALVSYPNIFMRLQLSELLEALFQDCSKNNSNLGLCTDHPARVIISLLCSSLLGIFLSSITFCLQIPAGIILPSMAIGACYGRAIGITTQLIRRFASGGFAFASCEPDGPCVSPGFYAIVGAASALGGVTRMTVSLVVITFELTGALRYVLPIMVAVMISKWVGDAFGKKGVYETWILLSNYPYLDLRLHYTREASISAVMTHVEDLVVLTSVGHTLEYMERILHKCPYNGFPVIDDSRIFMGYILRQQLGTGLANARKDGCHDSTLCYFTKSEYFPTTEPNLQLWDWMDHTPITLRPFDHMQVAINLFQKLGLRCIPLTKEGCLEGLITRKDVWFHVSATQHGQASDFGPDGSTVPYSLLQTQDGGS